MYKNILTQNFEPPQGLHIPEKKKIDWRTHNPVVLDPADAEEFYAKLEEVRAALPDHQKHFLKKDRELAELQSPNTRLIGIKNEFNELVSGVMVIMPVTRMIAKKYQDYPFDANAESTALLSALWTDINHRGNRYAPANINKVVELAKAEGISNVLTGIADTNPVSSSFEAATEYADKKFSRIHSRIRPAQDDQPEYLMHYHRLTFFTPSRLP